MGIYLPTDFFSHGHLYVALSRVGSGKSVKIYKPKDSPSFGYMKNVVYQEVLSKELPSEPHPVYDKEKEKESVPFWPLPSNRLKRKDYVEQKAEAPKRLKSVGFKLRQETPEDGNCFIHAVLDQMRFVIINRKYEKF